jgi:amino acid adenylation domain-containing protein
LVSEASQQNPEAIALSLAGKQMTYRELDHQAERLAAHLQSLGVRRESVVAICVERTFDYVVAALAIWKAGGAYLPVDPHWPVERRNFVLGNARAEVTIVRGPIDLKARFVLDLDWEYEMVAALRGPVSPVKINRDSLACVIYTSESTGQPKGVEMTHGNLLNLVFWHRRAFGVTSRDRGSFLAGLGFDPSVWELWPYLTTGAEIAMVPESIRTSADELRVWLSRENITMSFVPAALADQMLSADWPGATRLRYLLAGAGILHRHPSPDLPFRVVHSYGSAESTVVSMSGNAPVANAFVYLLNERFQPVKPGETGEIFLGGAGVARGYRNDADLTKQRFFEDPFRGIPGTMYRTGDLASLLPNGQYVFHGRKDSQERIYGQPVDLDEITSVLMAHSAVKTGTVIPIDAAYAENRLAAYVVLKHGAEVTARQLREHLARTFPDSLLPFAFVKLEALPLDLSGKLSRAALPAPVPENILREGDYLAPDTPVEVELAYLWRDLLDVRRVGLDDNFFLLGGSPALGMDLLARIRDSFGVGLHLHHLFEAPTLEKLAPVIERFLIEKGAAMSSEEAKRLLADWRPGV